MTAEPDAPAEPERTPVHVEPHFMAHRLTGRPWCICPCSECSGHVEGLEGMDCVCAGCTCGDVESAESLDGKGDFR
jgi:hypothetical protein